MRPTELTTQRRRGTSLEAAIHAAVFEELAEAGHGGLTLEKVAARARTSRSSLYRRWSSLDELILAAIQNALPDLPTPADDGDIRAELVGVLDKMAQALAGPVGRALASILTDLTRSTTLHAAVREKIIAPRLRAVHAILERAASRGEIRPGAATPFVVQAGPSIVVQNVLLQGLRLSTKDIEDIVDQVVLPALRP
ncbi:TetR-like C-terminal domain-containing protein [Fodinicola acaciae]|uniref:TetR-like C-terminal domain-containing protein n=1 Tax=Fodinicola acaciae TaxID=2681555 RepID=UPI0013D6FA8C|nr:TetR/AcrR family transcriptional regulator [Fodinicola acaciae]